MGAFLSYQTMTPPWTDELARTNTMLLKHPLLWVFVFLWSKQKGGTCLTCVKKLSVQESTSHLPPPSLLLFTSLQIDNKGWNGQKASFTEATSNCEYQHVSLCFFPFPSPSPLLLPIIPSIPQVVLVAEKARRLISVTGQWASDCQLNQPCVLVGSLQIQAHSHQLTGPHTEALWGATPTSF